MSSKSPLPPTVYRLASIDSANHRATFHPYGRDNATMVVASFTDYPELRDILQQLLCERIDGDLNHEQYIYRVADAIEETMLEAELLVFDDEERRLYTARDYHDLVEERESERAYRDEVSSVQFSGRY